MYEIIMQDELYHHGVLGQKWGVRRYQNEDGSLTNAGKRKLDAYKKNQTRWANRRYNDTIDIYSSQLKQAKKRKEKKKETDDSKIKELEKIINENKSNLGKELKYIENMKFSDMKKEQEIMYGYLNAKKLAGYTVAVLVSGVITGGASAQTIIRADQADRIAERSANRLREMSKKG